MTREQALAVAWTGLAALAINGQVRFVNDPKTSRLHVVIANARVDKVPTPSGKNTLKLVDLESANAGSANA